MGVGLRPTGKPVDMPPNPTAAAPRFYSTKYSVEFGDALLFYSFQVILLEPVHDGKKVDDRGNERCRERWGR